ncbi:MAG: hypothetical protein ACREK3_05605, partial [Gemmatimonadota bacterium]
MAESGLALQVRLERRKRACRQRRQIDRRELPLTPLEKEAQALPGQVVHQREDAVGGALHLGGPEVAAVIDGVDLGHQAELGADPDGRSQDRVAGARLPGDIQRGCPVGPLSPGDSLFPAGEERAA